MEPNVFKDKGGILWSDPVAAIDWPVKDPTLCDKDQQYPCLTDLKLQKP